MELNLRTTRFHYDEKEHEKEMKKLKELGFTFSPYEESGDLVIEGEPKIKFETVDELMAFVKEWKQVVISRKHKNFEYIEIYNYWRE
jgi:hypothetical protein